MKQTIKSAVVLLLAMSSTAVWAQGLKDAYKKEFMIGVAVNGRNVSNPEQMALIKKEFNSITAENDMKPQPTEPKEGQFNWEAADRIANFARQNGIKLRGHCLMWHSQIGEWMLGDNPTKEVFYARMKNHIQQVVSRYKDVVYCWDVVNEAMTDDKNAMDPYRQSAMYKLCGDEFIAKAFQFAREADPKALLFYNDYNECDPVKSQRIYNMVKAMKQAGVPIDGIGMQGHYNIYGPTEKEVDDAITLYKKIVKHIHVTELDIRVNEEMGGQLRFSRDGATVTDSVKQHLADQYARVFRVFRKHSDVIDCVTFWNLGDRDSWLGAANYPLPFDSEYKPKLAYEYIKAKKAPAWDMPKKPVRQPRAQQQQRQQPREFNAAMAFRKVDGVKDDFKPSSKNQPGQEYPQVNSQGYVRFRVQAPDAKAVTVSLGLGGQGGTKLRRFFDGSWIGQTEGPMDEGFHYYHLTVDGGTLNDPGTNNYFGSCRWESGIEIPAKDQDFYAEKNVEHGQVSEVRFWSESTNCLRRAFVYLPPTYGKNKKEKFPVLYLQHGWGENEYAWSNQGHANLIMDNLLAEGKCKPFIIVMTYGMTNDIKFGGLGGFTAKEFETVLCDELVPYIDSHFNTIAKKESRAMAGLSMGGMETKTITLRRPEMFGSWGLLSGGTYAPEDIKDPKQVKYIFESCGSKENPEGINKSVEALKAAGYNAQGYVSEGTAHEFLTWRRSLYQMAQRLFQ